MDGDMWAVGIIDKPIGLFVDPALQPMPVWIEPPAGKYLADPFAVHHQGRYYLFCEDWDVSVARGRIVVLESADLRSFGNPQPVIERPFHLSYPFVFRYEAEWYCLPEQCQADNVTLYRAKHFPNCWVESHVLVPGFPGVDPTIFNHDGLWWLFVGRHTDDWREPADAAYLFSASRLEGPWLPHPANPVVERRRRARSAGRVIDLGGRLVRPVQDSTYTYGEGLLFFEIDAINRHEYSEHQIGAWPKCRAWPYGRGIHHYELLEGKVIIDAKK